MPPHTSKGVLHNQREQAKTTAACAGFARFLKLDGFLVVGGGYEGQDPSDRMLAGRWRLRRDQCFAVPAALRTACKGAPSHDAPATTLAPRPLESFPMLQRCLRPCWAPSGRTRAATTTLSAACTPAWPAPTCTKRPLLLQ